MGSKFLQRIFLWRLQDPLSADNTFRKRMRANYANENN